MTAARTLALAGLLAAAAGGADQATLDRGQKEEARRTDSALGLYHQVDAPAATSPPRDDGPPVSMEDLTIPSSASYLEATKTLNLRFEGRLEPLALNRPASLLGKG